MHNSQKQTKKNKTERVEKRQSWSCLGDQPAAQSLAGLMAADRNSHTPPKPGKGQRLLDSGQWSSAENESFSQKCQWVTAEYEKLRETVCTRRNLRHASTSAAGVTDEDSREPAGAAGWPRRCDGSRDPALSHQLLGPAGQRDVDAILFIYKNGQKYPIPVQF